MTPELVALVVAVAVAVTRELLSWRDRRSRRRGEMRTRSSDGHPDDKPGPRWIG